MRPYLMHTAASTTIHIPLCLIGSITPNIQNQNLWQTEARYYKCESKREHPSLCTVFFLLSMPLSKFSDTLNLHDVVKARSRIVLTHQTITNKLAPISLKNPLVLNSSSGTVNSQMTGFYREIHEYCTVDVALLNSGCMMFIV